MLALMLLTDARRLARNCRQPGSDPQEDDTLGLLFMCCAGAETRLDACAYGHCTGVGLRLGVDGYMADLLFEVKPTDAPTFCGAAILFCVGGIGCVLCAGAARHARGPMVSLRYE